MNFWYNIAKPFTTTYLDCVLLAGHSYNKAKGYRVCTVSFLPKPKLKSDLQCLAEHVDIIE